MTRTQAGSAPAVVLSVAAATPAAERVVRLAVAMVTDGGFAGLQLAVCRPDGCVLELAAGQGEAGASVQVGSMLGILSATKLLTTLVVHHLHDAGRFAYDDPVAAHWPEFAAHDKETITIAQVLSHRSGLAPPPYAGYVDWPAFADRRSTARLVEDMTPLWSPGSTNGYHAHTFGHVLGELVARWTGADVGQVLRQVVLEPLGLEADVCIGADAAALRRFVPFLPAIPAGPVPAFTPPAGGERHFFNSEAMLRLCLPWGGGLASARALAEVMMVLALGGTHRDVRVIDESTFVGLTSPTNQADDVDRILRTRARWGLGVLLGVTEGTMMTRGAIFGRTAGPRVCGMLGGNSCVTWADPDNRLSMALIATGAPRPADYQTLGDAVRAAFADGESR